MERVVSIPLSGCLRPAREIARPRILEKADGIEQESFGRQITLDQERIIRARESINYVVDAIVLAFSEERPFVVTPQVFWFMIVSGFAQHVNANSETMRRFFVHHDGKLNLEVIRNSFVMGQTNDWEGVFDEFCVQIREHTGNEIFDMLVFDIEGCGEADRAALAIAFMETCKSFFNYTVFTRCGIPRIDVHGSPETWRDMRARVAKMGNNKDYDIKWWTDRLLPILDNIVAAVEGKVDEAFWKNMVKYQSMSGHSDVTGWINEFFPYETQHRRRTDWTSTSDMKYPLSTTQTDFVWDYCGTKFPMQFRGGIVAVVEEKDLAIKPTLGWTIAHRVCVGSPTK